MINYEIEGLNVFNLLKHIPNDTNLIKPVVIPTNIIANLDDETQITFLFKNSKTISTFINAPNDNMSPAAYERLQGFIATVKKMGFEIKDFE